MTREELENTYEAALNDAAKQLSYRELSASALREKLLKKGHSEDAVDYALAWLTERKLLDDSRFAESTVHSYGRRGYGTLRIRQELHRRGVSREDAAAAMEDYAPDDAMLLALLDKKLQGDCPTPGQCSAQSRICSGVGFHGAISAAHSTNMAQPWMSQFDG